MDHLLHAILPFLFAMVVAGDGQCPSVCTCETAALHDLPINSVLVTSQFNHPDQPSLPSYKDQNEVLDESDEKQAEHNLGEGKLKAASCILEPENNLSLFMSLPTDIQVLMLLQGPSKINVTLEKDYFEHLQNLIVLEIHGFAHKPGILKLKKNALENLQKLVYINFQYVHLVGDPEIGNRQLPASSALVMERDFLSQQRDREESDIDEAIQLIPYKVGGEEVIPYSLYKEQEERAGLSTFAGLHNLRFLRLFHCNIKEVNWEMFDGLQSLEYLSLEGNKIPFLHEFSFYGTPNLKHLSISHNKLLSIQSTGLIGLLKLEVLDLSYNNISHLSELSLPPLPKLITADFHHNPLELILPNTFQVMNNTQNLFLGGIFAKLEVRHKSFSGLKKIKKISLSGVHLEILHREYLEGMRSLRELRMEGTIHEIEFDAFAEVPKLQELILKHCSINRISMDAFFGLYGLVYLDLSHNELETLPPSLFDQQHNLKEIYLHNNKLTYLPDDLFTNVPAKLIRLEKNPWHCTCAMSSWQPTQINKIKVKLMDKTMCQTRYDKGSMCKVNYTYQYKYEQSVSPQCATPARYTGWSVFHLLRKHLRCVEKIVKKNKQHYEPLAFNSTQQSNRGLTYLNVSSPVEETQTLPLSLEGNNEQPTVNESLPIVDVPSKESHELKLDQPERLNETSPTVKENYNTSTNAPGKIKDDKPDNQFMWTQRNKDKYKLLQAKEDRISKKLNSTILSTLTEKNTKGFKVPMDRSAKIRKQTSNQKKWEMKMGNTKRRLGSSDNHPNDL